MVKFINLPNWGLLNLAHVESICPEYDDDYKKPIGYRINYCHNHSDFMSIEDYEHLLKHMPQIC